MHLWYLQWFSFDADILACGTRDHRRDAHPLRWRGPACPLVCSCDTNWIVIKLVFLTLQRQIRTCVPFRTERPTLHMSRNARCLIVDLMDLVPEKNFKFFRLNWLTLLIWVQLTLRSETKCFSKGSIIADSGEDARGLMVITSGKVQCLCLLPAYAELFPEIEMTSSSY